MEHSPPLKRSWTGEYRGTNEVQNILVTGGSGFIGSHPVEMLLNRNYRVLVLDDPSSGSVKNIEHLRYHPRFEFMLENINASHILIEMVDLADLIIHLAPTVGVFNIIKSPVKTITNNINSTEVVLKAAAKKKKRVIIVC